jgi:prepilin-type N-terminal cleavage/methylation domain-containing protein
MMKTISKKNVKNSGFTLIELLIVIGLLAALAAVLLPLLGGDRDKALANIDKYNKAGTLRTLRQYEAVTGGKLPNGMHTGLTDTTGSTLMEVPERFRTNAAGSVEALTADDIDALNSAGITKLAYGKGDKTATDSATILGYEDLVVGDNVIVATSAWQDEDGNTLTFNGKTIADLNGEGYLKIINLFVTPTADWNASGKGWVEGFNVKMDIPGTCPIPDEAFSYYTAFIGIMPKDTAYYSVSSSGDGTPPEPTSKTAVDESTLQIDIDSAITGDWSWVGSWTDGTRTALYSNGGQTGSATYTVKLTEESKAVLIGSSCPEHGVTNP